MPEEVKTEQVQQASDEEAKFKTYLKDRYGIEDDPDTFKGKYASLKKAAEEDLPQYQSTLTALIEAARAQAANQPQRQAPVRQAEDDEEQLRTVARMDPYEGMKAYFAKQQVDNDAKYAEVIQRARAEAEEVAMRRDMQTQAAEITRANWPEAWDPESDLHKLGKVIYHAEMSQFERNHPRAVLIATERAAGRLGLAPQGKRNSPAASRAELEHQNVAGQGRKTRSDDSDDVELTPKQKAIAAEIGVDPENYKKTIKARKEGKNLRVG